MAEINKIKVSELPEEMNGDGFWIFGYKNEGGRATSRKLGFKKLIEIVEKAAAGIQLERRIAVVLERSEQLVPIGEKMTITKLVSRNIAEITYRENKVGSNWAELKAGVVLSGANDIILKIVNPGENVGYGNYDKYSTITIFAKAELKQ